MTVTKSGMKDDKTHFYKHFVIVTSALSTSNADKTPVPVSFKCFGHTHTHTHGWVGVEW